MLPSLIWLLTRRKGSFSLYLCGKKVKCLSREGSALIRSTINPVSFEQSKTPEIRYYALVSVALRMPDVFTQLGLISLASLTNIHLSHMNALRKLHCSMIACPSFKISFSSLIHFKLASYLHLCAHLRSL